VIMVPQRSAPCNLPRRALFHGVSRTVDYRVRA
jgi:hypothetical protein